MTPQRCRELLGRFGVVEPQAATDWMGDVLLPEPIARFYEMVGPSDVTVPSEGEPYFFPRLTSLWDVQAGYRYNALSGEPLPGWDDDWLVIVDRPADPILYSRSTGKLLDRRGRPLFDNLYDMVESLCATSAAS